MSDDPEGRFQITLMANDSLLRAVVVRLMQLDPGFAQDARQWFDQILGAFSTSEDAVGTAPHVLSEIREECLRQLARAEKQARIVSATPEPKTIRRSIFECLNVASSRLG